MFYVEIFLLLIFTVLCAILLALWSIRAQLERIGGGSGALDAAPPASSTGASRPPAA